MLRVDWTRMIKLAGHTMGTPGMDLFEAMALFRELGYEGIEIRVASDGQLDVDAWTSGQRDAVVRRAGEVGIAICCLTSYYRDFVSPEKRDAEIAGLKRVAEIAADLGCPLIRAMGGACNTPEKRESVIRERGIAGLREAADHAAPLGVKLAVETHIGYQCLSARGTAEFVANVDHPHVGILLDYAWVHYAGSETAREAVEAACPYLLHCHAKDWSYPDGDRERRRAALMGEGDVDLRAFLAALREIGYQGYVSDEYEKYWYDHLPEPRVGMGHNAKFLRKGVTAC